MPQPSSSAIFFGLLTQTQKEEVVQDAAEEAAARFMGYMDALRQSVGLPQLTGQERLEAFRQRQPEIWSHMQQAFPLEYEKQLVDWRRLETAAMRNPNMQRETEGGIATTNVPSGLGLPTPTSDLTGTS